MARVLRSGKITIAEDDTSFTAQQQELDSQLTATGEQQRAPLDAVQNVTEEVVVSVQDALEAEEEKLLKAAFKSQIGIKKKKSKRQLAKRAAKKASRDEAYANASEDNTTPIDESNTGSADNATKPGGDGNLMFLLKGMADTNINDDKLDITSIRNVPLEPATLRRTRSMKNLPPQPGMYQYNYPPRGGVPFQNQGPAHMFPRGHGGGSYRAPPHHAPPQARPNFATMSGRFYRGGYREDPFRQNGPIPFGAPPPHVIPVFQPPPAPPQIPQHHTFHFGQQGPFFNIHEQQMLQQNMVQQWLFENNRQRYWSDANGNGFQEPVPQQEQDFVQIAEQRLPSYSTVEFPTPQESIAPGEEAGFVPNASKPMEASGGFMDGVRQNRQVSESTAIYMPVEDENEPEDARMEDAEEPAEDITSEETEIVEQKTITVTERGGGYDNVEVEAVEDSFIQNIVDRSPSKPVHRRSSVEHVIERLASRHASPDIERFEDVITRSTAKPVQRIDDSVEKLDLMEDVFEALSEATNIASPLKPRKLFAAPAPTPASQALTRKSTVATRPTPASTRTATRPAATKPSTTLTTRGGRAPAPTPARQNFSSAAATIRARPTDRKSVMSTISTTSSTGGANRLLHARSASAASSAPKSSVAGTPFSTIRPATKRPVSLLPPKPLVKPSASKPATRPTFELPGEKIARELKEKREARAAQRAEAEADKAASLAAAKAAAPRVKSTKVVTKPTFELPGDAVSRRKREEHAVRLKAQEEEERKRREFKARPVARKSVVVPRETAASLARKSVVGMSSTEKALRPGINELDHKNTIAAQAARTHVVPRVARPASITPKPSLTSQRERASMRRSISGMSGVSGISTAAAVGTSKGKEVFNRGIVSVQNAEAERKAKEEAARRARAEAAERGRAASRAWAEAMRVKREGGAGGAGAAEAAEAA